MKAHGCVDAASGIDQSLETTTAKVRDSQVWNELLQGRETSVWTGNGYFDAALQAAFATVGNSWGVMKKASKDGALPPIDADINCLILK